MIDPINSDLVQAFRKKKVLITGGMGFIGSNLAMKLLPLVAQVCIVDNPSLEFSGERYNLNGMDDEIQIIFADISDPAKMADLIPEQDYLFNLAGQISHMGSLADPMADLQSNTVAQVSLLDMCRRLNPELRIVYGSTRQIYGRPRYLPVDECHPLEPVDFNGVSKLAGERYHQLSHLIHQSKISSLRMTNVYGPRMRIRDAYKSFIGLWIRQLLNGEEITIYGDGQQLRDLNFVADVANALLACAIHPQAVGQVYNIGAEPISLIALAQLMIQINGAGSYRLVPYPQERKKIDIGSYYTNYQKINRELGWLPQISLEDGLTETLAFFRENWAQYQ